MRIVTLILCAASISTAGFAATPAMTSSQALSAMKSVWQAKEPVNFKPGHHDLNIVYGGEDVSRQPTLAPHTITA